jgi:hypothetical protein
MTQHTIPTTSCGVSIGATLEGLGIRGTNIPPIFLYVRSFSFLATDLKRSK